LPFGIIQKGACRLRQHDDAQRRDQHRIARIVRTGPGQHTAADNEADKCAKLCVFSGQLHEGEPAPAEREQYSGRIEGRGIAVNRASSGSSVGGAAEADIGLDKAEYRHPCHPKPENVRCDHATQCIGQKPGRQDMHLPDEPGELQHQGIALIADINFLFLCCLHNYFPGTVRPIYLEPLPGTFVDGAFMLDGEG